MTLARDFSHFADATNAELDGIVNDLAEQSKRVTAAEAELEAHKSDDREMYERVFERLGSVVQKLECLEKLETDVATVKRLVTSIHDGHVHDMRDVRKRLGVLEAKAANVTHPDEETTPARPRSPLPR